MTPPSCPCGQPLTAAQPVYCSARCRFEDDDHGPNGDDQ